MSESGNERVITEVQAKAKELERLLNDFSDRLRRLRQRNRQVEEEIASFEEELDRLRRDVLDAAEERFE
jgi:uncharacterized protein Yka (UPF0111/DUF47 family)